MRSNTASASLPLPPPASAPAGDDFHPSDKGWTQIWSDEFEGENLDRTKWVPEISCWGGGNYERQCYTDRIKNVSIVNGQLRLTARPEKFTGPKFPQDMDSQRVQITQPYTSGKVRTKGLTDWKYGRFEARMKLPKGQGTWPAFWMMPADDIYGPWPLSGEIDIMEAVNLGAKCDDCENSKVENRTSGTLHFGKRPPNNTYKGDEHKLPTSPSDYHVFAAEWGEGQINWFVDGRLFQTQTSKDWFTAAVDKADNPNAPFDASFYLMFNNAVGGNYPENTNEKGFDPSAFPNDLLIDWVRVYQCANDIETGLSCMAKPI